MHIYVCINDCLALLQKLIQHCKSTYFNKIILKIKKEDKSYKFNRIACIAFKLTV